MLMLSGEKLGSALREAMRLKGVGATAVARHFGIKPPSVYDWMERGCIDKKHLGRLVQFFVDVVPPSHWGVEPLEMQTLSSAWIAQTTDHDQHSSQRTVAAEQPSVYLAGASGPFTTSLDFGTSNASAPVIAWADLDVLLMRPNWEWPEEALVSFGAIKRAVSDKVKLVRVLESKIPTIEPGDRIAIDPEALPEDDNVVLVKNHKGKLELARYRALADGSWEAMVPNEPARDPNKYGLSVVAVVVGLNKAKF